jgi:hypothetical protein
MATVTTPWSEGLQEQTRDAIKELRVAPDGRMHFKHKALGYAYISLEDMVSNRLVLHAKKGDLEYAFSDVAALLTGGWAVD